MPSGASAQRVAAPPPRRVGPAAEWAAKWGTMRVELFHRTTGKATEVRTSLLAGF